MLIKDLAFVATGLSIHCHTSESVSSVDPKCEVCRSALISK